MFPSFKGDASPVGWRFVWRKSCTDAAVGGGCLLLAMDQCFFAPFPFGLPRSVPKTAPAKGVLRVARIPFEELFVGL